MESVNCNLCQSSQSIDLYHLTDLLLEREEACTTLVRCMDCGLIYQNPRPSLVEIGRHYPPEYDSYHPEPQGEKTSWLLSKAIQYGIDKRCRFVTQQKERGRLLDIGCATGLFLKGMQRHPGWELNGVEISPHAASIARHRHQLDVFTGTLEQAAFPDNHFEAVTMWDVLEHLHDPAASLSEIHRILKPGGVLVVRVPNAGSWDASLFGSCWAGLDAPRHLYVFDQDTLQAMLVKSGFQVRQVSCGIGSYPTFVLSVRFWLVARGTSVQTRNALVNMLYHPLARLFSSPFFYLSGLRQRGPLITVTAGKRS